MSHTNSVFRFIEPAFHTLPVPDEWVQNATECIYPDMRSVEGSQQLAKKGLKKLSQGYSWILCKGKCLKRKLSWDDACQRAKDDKSRKYVGSLTTPEKDSPLAKRRRLPNQRYNKDVYSFESPVVLEKSLLSRPPASPTTAKNNNAHRRILFSAEKCTMVPESTASSSDNRISTQNLDVNYNIDLIATSGHVLENEVVKSFITIDTNRSSSPDSLTGTILENYDPKTVKKISSKKINLIGNNNNQCEKNGNPELCDDDVSNNNNDQAYIDVECNDSEEEHKTSSRRSSTPSWSGCSNNSFFSDANSVLSSPTSIKTPLKPSGRVSKSSSASKSITVDNLSGSHVSRSQDSSINKNLNSNRHNSNTYTNKPSTSKSSNRSLSSSHKNSNDKNHSVKNDHSSHHKSKSTSGEKRPRTHASKSPKNTGRSGHLGHSHGNEQSVENESSHKKSRTSGDTSSKYSSRTKSLSASREHSSDRNKVENQPIPEKSNTKSSKKSPHKTHKTSKHSPCKSANSSKRTPHKTDRNSSKTTDSTSKKITPKKDHKISKKSPHIIESKESPRTKDRSSNKSPHKSHTHKKNQDSKSSNISHHNHKTSSNNTHGHSRSRSTSRGSVNRSGLHTSQDSDSTQVDETGTMEHEKRNQIKYSIDDFANMSTQAFQKFVGASLLTLKEALNVTTQFSKKSQKSADNPTDINSGFKALKIQYTSLNEVRELEQKLKISKFRKIWVNEVRELSTYVIPSESSAKDGAAKVMKHIFHIDLLNQMSYKGMTTSKKAKNAPPKFPIIDTNLMKSLYEALKKLSKTLSPVKRGIQNSMWQSNNATTRKSRQQEAEKDF